VADLGVNFNGKTYVSDYSNGNLYYYSDNSYTDAGQPIKRQLTTRHIRDGGNELRISTVFLEMETGVGLISGQGSDPKISMEKSKDNGRTWGIPRVTSFGKMGQYQTPRAIWNRCGSAKDFVFRFTMTDPVDFIVTGGAASLGQSASKKEGGA
jgi:Neuraminidase (sialidase)